MSRNFVRSMPGKKRVTVTPEQEAEIRRLAGEGYGLSAIARYMKLSADLVHVVMTRLGLTRQMGGSGRKAPITLPSFAASGRLAAGVSDAASKERSLPGARKEHSS